MKFTSYTKDELLDAMLLPAGTYPFTIIEAQDTVSKAGNDMIKLQLRVYTPDGADRFVYDYLLEKFGLKLLAFCESVGLEGAYAAGELNAELCKGREGFVKLEIRGAQGGFGPQNQVESYVPRGVVPEGTAKSAPTTQIPGIPDDADEIPF